MLRWPHSRVYISTEVPTEEKVSKRLVFADTGMYTSTSGRGDPLPLILHEYGRSACGPGSLVELQRDWYRDYAGIEIKHCSGTASLITYT